MANETVVIKSLKITLFQREPLWMHISAYEITHLTKAIDSG